MHTTKVDMPYGTYIYSSPSLFAITLALDTNPSVVRLGKSGLKVSKIILGCMSYGNDTWGEWILGEKEGIEHIKAAYAAGINVCEIALLVWIFY